MYERYRDLLESDLELRAVLKGELDEEAVEELQISFDTEGLRSEAEKSKQTDPLIHGA